MPGAPHKKGTNVSTTVAEERESAVPPNSRVAKDRDRVQAELKKSKLKERGPTNVISGLNGEQWRISGS